MQYSVTRRFQFCSGHRIFGHESKCAHPHGHNYVLLATFEPVKGLDHLDRVIDFSHIKTLLGDWIDKNWDHGFLFYCIDTELKEFYEKHTLMKSFCAAWNPTAEKMAEYILNIVCPQLFSTVVCTKVELWETENCKAEAVLE